MTLQEGKGVPEMTSGSLACSLFDYWKTQGALYRLKMRGSYIFYTVWPLASDLGTPIEVTISYGITTRYIALVQQVNNMD